MSYRRGTYTSIGIAGAAVLQADEAQLCTKALKHHAQAYMATS
jgi:hypothetical protein